MYSDLEFDVEPEFHGEAIEGLLWAVLFSAPIWLGIAALVRHLFGI